MADKKKFTNSLTETINKSFNLDKIPAGPARDQAELAYSSLASGIADSVDQYVVVIVNDIDTGAESKKGEKGDPGPPGTSPGMPDGDYTDVMITMKSKVITVNPGVITNAKLATVAGSTLKGNISVATAAPSDLTTTQVRSLLSISNVENTALTTWTGSSSITTLGTIVTGVWHGTAVTEVYGGTGQSSYTLGDTIYGSGTNTLAKLAGNTTTTRNFLRQTGNGAVSAAPAWDTVTKTDVGLSNVENTALSTWAGTTNITTLGTISTGTWTGSAIAAAYIGDLSATYSPRAGNTSLVTLGTVTAGTWNATTIGATYGGTAQSTWTLGDILYSSATNALSKLAGNTTTTRNFLRQTGNGAVSAAPAWDTVTKTDVGLSNVENTALSTWAGSSNITTIGAASGTSLAVTGLLKSSSTSAGVGYATGAGSSVTQASTRSTGVTVNAICGTITGNSTSLAAGADATFVVTNSSVALRDVVILSIVSGPTANTSIFTISAVAAGSFSIRIKNVSASTADTGAPIINFAIIKAVNT